MKIGPKDNAHQRRGPTARNAVRGGGSPVTGVNERPRGSLDRILAC
jgi:hypothetical protein